MSDNVLGRKGHVFLGVVAALYLVVFALRPTGALDALRTTVRMHRAIMGRHAPGGRAHRDDIDLMAM